MICFILLIVGNALAVTSELSLKCTNDLITTISCYTEAHNCSRLSLRMARLYNAYESMTGRCEFEACDRGCCCTTTLEFLSLRDTFSAEMFKDGQSLHNQTISIEDTFKPPAPSISVEQFSGIHKIQWCTNAKKYIRDDLEAVVTYQKKGSNSKTFEHRGQSTKVSESTKVNCYEMYGPRLEPNTTYVLSVRTIRNPGVFSDSSNEKKFTTPLEQTSTNGGLIALILCLSVAAIIVSAATFILIFRLKGKLWDKVKEERPKILDFKPNKEVILRPESLSVTSLSVEPLIPKVSLTLSKESLYFSSSGQTSGISSASSSPAYNDLHPEDIGARVLEALGSVFPNFPAARDTSSSDDPPQGNTSSPPLEKTPSPIFLHNGCYFSNHQADSTDDVDMQMNYDIGYNSSDCPPLHDFIAPPHASVAMETDMSYQSCAPSGEASGCSQNLPVIYGYQGFEKLVEQSNNMSSMQETVDSLIQGVSDAAPRISNEIIVDYGYHCA